MWSLLTTYFNNPRIVVSVRWHECGHYGVNELRSMFLKAVEHDYTGLTQFVGRDELICRLNASTSFKEFVSAWQWLSTESSTL
jgi:hypothetical protein